MDIAGGLVFFLIVCFLCLSGPIAFFWSFRLQRRLDDLAEQNAKLESTLQRLRQEPRTEHQEQPAQPVPVHPAAPVPNIQSVDKFVSRPSFRDAPFRLLFISPNKSRNE
ncbi:MAG: hypothetical protein FWC43_11495, partial [Planctomycetaceae bacterium]|nr:hypothetical protein [Planctomycetaceae bacterium]